MKKHWAESVEMIADYLNNRGVLEVDYAFVMGTGLSASSILHEKLLDIPYSDLPGFPVSTVEGHEGSLSYGTRGKSKILVFKGRFHYYEGYDMDQVTLYVHALAALKSKVLIITNAAGGLNPHFTNGNLVLVTDHINLFPSHPLRGQWPESMGPRFPDMLDAYPQEWRSKLIKAAESAGIELKQGVYLGWQGPSLETPAEYKMARILGADLIGMSTVPEVIVAKYRSLPVGVISVVSNVCFPASAIKATGLEDILYVMENSAAKLSSLLSALIDNNQ